MSKKRWDKLMTFLFILMTLVYFSISFSPGGKVYAQDETMTVYFSESTSQRQSKTINIQNLQSISSMTVNTGNVTYTVNGDNVTINVSNGNSSSTYTPSKGVSVQLQRDDTNFPYSYYYNSGGYSGSIYKYGDYSSTLISGSPADSKSVSTSFNSGLEYPPNTYNYNSGGYSGTLSRTSVSNSPFTQDQSKQFSASWPNTVTNNWDCAGNLISTTDSSPAPSSYYINSDGYTGYIPRTGTNGPTNQSTTYCTTSSHNPKHKIKYSRTYTALYSGTLTKKVTYNNYTGYYSGTATKPDTRVWGAPYTQIYSGTVYGSSTYYYSYTVTIKYQVKASPSISIQAPVSNSIFCEADTAYVPSISVSDDNNDTLTCKYFIDSETSPRDTKTVSNTSAAKTVTFTPINMNTLTEGSHTIKFEVSDGITAAVQTTASFKVDKSPPVFNTVNITSSTNSITISGSAADSVSGLAQYPYRYTVDGSVSSWVTGTSYTKDNLTPNTPHTAKFEAKDVKAHIAVRTMSIYTKAALPILAANNATSYSVDISTSDANPELTTQYQITAGSQYISSTGVLTSVPSWITLKNKKITVTGLAPNTTYTFQAKGRNEEGVETSLCPSVSITTLIAPPATPSNLRTTSVSQTSISLAWDGVPGAEGYDLELDGVVINAGSSNVYTHNGLSASTSHTYRVRAKNAGNPATSDWSNQLSLSTLPYPPAVPENIQVEPSTGSMMISWSSADGASDYDIETDGAVKDCSSSVNFEHNGLTVNSQHIYRVRAKNAGGTSAWSNQVAKYTLASIPEDGSVGKITNNSIGAAWTAGGNPEGTFFALAIFDENDAILKQNAWTLKNEDNITGLNPSKNYSVKVKAKNNDGVETSWHQIGQVTTLPDAPVMPSGITATSGSNSVTLQWNPVYGAQKYEVEVDGVRVEDNGANTIYVHNGLLPQTQHSYKIRAVNAGGISEWSTAISKSTLPLKPSTPININVLGTATAVTVSWEQADGATGYEIEADGVVINVGTSMTYSHYGLGPGTTHTYRVRSRNEGGKSDWSQFVAGYTQASIPDVPVNISTVSTDTSITVSWQAVHGATGYDLETGNQEQISVVDAVYLHDMLTPGTTYSYRVRAKNSAGTGEWSTTVSASTQLQVSGAPPNFRAFPTDTSIVLAWDGIENAESYDIEVDGKVINTGLQTSYTHTGLTPNTGHIYRVRAVADGKPGQWSIQLTKMTLPGLPQNITVMTSVTTVNINWDSEDGIVGYDVEVDGEIVSSGIASNYTNSGLAPGTQHNYRIRVRNKEGAGPWSNVIYAVTATDIYYVPSNVTTEASGTSITFTWDVIDGAIGYQIEVNGMETVSVAEAVYVHEGLRHNTQYSYRIRSNSSSGFSDWSREITVLTLPNIPGIPANFSSHAGYTSVMLSWELVPEADRYEIDADGVIINNGSLSGYTDSGLAPGTQHRYRIRAVNSAGAGIWSEPITVITLAEVSGAPQGIKATSTLTEIMISWNEVAEADSYDVEIDAGQQVNINETSYKHMALEPGTRHIYRVRARNGGGAGAWSSVIIMPTMLETPANLSVASAATCLTLTWGTVINADKYDVEIDGKFIETVQGTVYMHEGLMPGIAHIYRVRANNDAVSGKWTEEISGTTSVPEYSIDCTEGEEFNIVITASEIKDFSKYKFKLVYNPAELEVADLYAPTTKPDLSAGNIAGTDVRILENKLGIIVFSLNTVIEQGHTWSGVVSSIRFRALKTGSTVITYTLQ